MKLLVSLINIMIDIDDDDDTFSMVNIHLNDDDVHDTFSMVITPFSGCWKQQDHENEFTRGRTHQDMALFHHEGLYYYNSPFKDC